jgi:hypothetical protein
VLGPRALGRVAAKSCVTGPDPRRNVAVPERAPLVERMRNIEAYLPA